LPDRRHSHTIGIQLVNCDPRNARCRIFLAVTFAIGETKLGTGNIRRPAITSIHRKHMGALTRIRLQKNVDSFLCGIELNSRYLR
jgi:hypothetical protein